MAKQGEVTAALTGAPEIRQERNTLKSLISSVTVRARFEDMLGKKAAGFLSSILSATAANKELASANPMTVISAAAVAASLDLPINSSLGFAYIVPYKGEAQFQLGAKGFVQLAMRSGQYRTINLAVIYEGQIKRHNPFTGEMEFDNEKKSDRIVGYLLYFKLLNGYEKYFFMTYDEVFAHGKRYSQSFASDRSQWKKNFDAMALKTVCKLGLSKYGILSIEMEKAVKYDQAVVTPTDDAPVYVDSTTADTDVAEAEKPAEAVGAAA